MANLIQELTSVNSAYGIFIKLQEIDITWTIGDLNEY